MSKIDHQLYSSLNKQLSKQSVIALLVLFGSLFFPLTIQAQFGSGIKAPFDTAYSKDLTDGNQAFSTMELLISNVLGIMTTVGALVFIVYFLLGAIGWISAGGDSSKITKARDQMLQGVLGLIVLVALYAIVGFIGSIVGIDILNPAEMLQKLVPTTTS